MAASAYVAQGEGRWRATALTRFLNEDLIGQSNPLVTAKGADATLREVLLSARERVAMRFTEQPATEATVRANLAVMLNNLELFDDAESEVRRALGLQEQFDGAASEAALRTRTMLARILSRRGKLDEADSVLAEFERLIGATPSAVQRQLLATGRSTLYIGRSQFDKALVALREAVDGLDPSDRDSLGQRDSLRLDLISVLPFAGHNEEARKLGEKLIAEARARRDDSALLIALTQVAMARSYREDHDTAERILLEARPVIVAKLGEHHTRHLQLLGELLSVAFRRGDDILVAVTRWTVRLSQTGWGPTTLPLPAGSWTDKLTGYVASGPTPTVELFADLPVVLLERDHG